MQISPDNYTIYIQPALDDSGVFTSWLNQHQYSYVYVLCDDNTLQYCYPHIKQFLPTHTCITIPSGESEKNIETCKYLWQQFTDAQADRKSLLINLGGGVIGDMGGFVASTYKRGFDFINIPTTLLSQVDASVGGKLGIDFNGVKNIIGLFQNPKAVFISPEFLSTLPFEQLRSGFSEVLKHGLIYNAEYWHQQKGNAVQLNSNWLAAIEQSVLIKHDVVKKDPFESGLRKILNFGHTIGHAIETWSLQNETQPLLHGEAIAIGMICEAWLSNAVNGLPANELEEITHTFIQLFGKYPLEKIPFTAIMDVMQQDKKNSNKTIRFSLLHAIGNCDYDIQVSDALIAEALTYYCTLS